MRQKCLVYQGKTTTVALLKDFILILQETLLIPAFSGVRRAFSGVEGQHTYDGFCGLQGFGSASPDALTLHIPGCK